MIKKAGMMMLAAFLLAGFAINIEAARPTVKISAAPTTIIIGSSSTLTWTSTGANSASINNNIGSVPVNGSKVVTPTATTTYTITARNSSGSTTATATVTVKAAPPTVSFSAAPATIAPGGSSTLSWTTTKATSASINQNIGTVALNGSKVVKPTTTKTYTITVKGSGGTVTAAVTVTVTTAPPPIASLTANPVSIYRGQFSTLSWTTFDATSASINNGVGSVDLNGSLAVSPTFTTIYTLTATVPGGTTTDGAQIQVSVYPAPTATLAANPQAIQPGESATLSWTTANADSVMLDNGIGAVELNGSMTVSPAATTAYALTATGFGGTKTVSTIVIVSSGRKCYAFIPDSTDKTVRIVDTDTNVLFKTIVDSGTDTDLRGVAAEQSGVFVYIADRGHYENRILKIDPLTMTVVETLSLQGNFQGHPIHITVAPDGCFLYTTSSIPMWDPSSGKYVGDICTIKTSGDYLSAVRGIETDLPHQVSLEGLVVSKDNSRLYVADPDNSQILVLDTAKLQRWAAEMVPVSDELVATIPVSLPKELAVSPDGQKLYATSSGYLHEIDAAQFTVQRSLAVSGAQFLKVSPDGSRVYLMSGNALTTVETAGLTKLSTVAVTGMGTCSGFDVHPDGARLFMVDSYGKKLFMVNAADGQVISTLGLGSAPVAVGRFIGPLPISVTGNVRQDGNPLSGVTMTLNGEGILRTKLTPAAGDFIFALKPGNYSLTPTLSNLAFSPETMDLQVENSMTGLDFAVSGIVPPPTVTLAASKTWVKQFETFTLTWDSTGADYVTLELLTSDHLPPSGSRNDSLAKTSTIIAKAFSRGGTASASVMIVVSSGNPPTAAISASPASILQGGSSMLTWNVTGVSTVTIDNGIGTVAASGSKVVSPAATTTYTVTGTRSDGYQVTASTTVTVSEFDTSAKLTGTVSDLASNLPLAGVTVSAVDALGVPKTAVTDAAGKYTITNLRVGSITVSFAKSGYDPYQQTINIPANMTFDLTTQLRLTLVGATLHGLVKDGQTSLPIVGATVTAVFTGGSLTSTSGSDGAYALVGIPLNTLVTITASAVDYRNAVITQTFTQNATLTYNFVLYNLSAVATINGKITNSKTLLPEAGVKVTHDGSNIAVTTAADGTFIFDNILFGEQTFYLEKTDFIDEFMTYTIDRTPFTIDLIKPSSDGGEIKIDQNFSGIILDSVSQRPLSGAKVRVPVLNLEAVTDANGNYSLTGLLIGSYPVIALAVNHQSINFMATVAPGETNKLDIVLVPIAKGLISGTITDVATGEPVADASIEIEGSSFLVDASEGDGTYKMVGVPPDTYKVVVTHADYIQAFTENVEVFDLTPTTLNMQLNRRPQTGALEGRILDINTNNPVSGATVSVPGTAITATTDAEGNYRLTNVPAGVNNLTVSASGYPSSLRIRAVIADETPTSSSTTVTDIPIDPANSTVNEAVTQLIRASEGGDIISRDSRFVLHIFPDTLSADANITLMEATDGPSITLGSDLPLDPALEITGVKAASVMMKVQIASVNGNDPAPTIDGLAAVAMRYSQKDTDDFQLDENSAFPYFWDGTYFSALNPRPYELAVDKTNNIVYAVMDFSKTVTGGAAPFVQSSLPRSVTTKGFAATNTSLKERIIILGKIAKNILSYKPNVKIFDKNELNAVKSAPSKNIPNPNALPLLCIHGFDPWSTFVALETNPNKEERYYYMLEDIIDATNGVYRPVFVSYNTKAKIAAIGGKLAEKIYGEYLNQKAKIKGLPSKPDDPDSGTFPYLDTFSFSMGGVLARTFLNKSTVNMVHNMVMIAPTNHGTFNLLNHLSKNNPLFFATLNNLKWLNPGAADQLDYDDSSPAGQEQNPFLYDLNAPSNSRAVSPRGDMTLFAGNVEDGYGWLSSIFNPFLKSPHDSFVPVSSVYCRPSNAPESDLSLLHVYGKNAKIANVPPKNFSHANIGKFLKRISEFSNEIALGLSDWTVERVYNENPGDNLFIPPTKDNWGFAKSKVKVEYNVWVPDADRQARDYDRVVLVIYHKDGNGVWHISKTGENGADENGNVNGAKVKEIKGNSSTNFVGAQILFAIVNYEPTPGKNEAGYDPDKYVDDTTSLVIPLKPGKMTVPLDPTKAHFRTPNLNE